MELATIKTLSGTSPRKFIYNAKKANERIAELEAILASKNAAALPAAIAVAPTAAAAPAPAPELKGRERFIASCARVAAAKPKTQNYPALHGRARFVAAAALGNSPKI